MTDCSNCIVASERAWHSFTLGCMVCQARRIASGPACAFAAQVGYITPEYRAELYAVAGDAHWQALHELVRAYRRGDNPLIGQLDAHTVHEGR